MNSTHNPPKYKSADQLSSKASYGWLLFIVLVVLGIWFRHYQIYINAGGRPDFYFWDIGWYRTIALEGYSFGADYETKQYPVAFFPMYPLLVRWLLNAIPMEVSYAMMIVSMVSTIIATVLYFLTIRKCFNGLIAVFSCVLLLLNPFGWYFFVGYTESLQLLLVAAFFYFLLVRKNYFLATVAVAVGTATKQSFVFLGFSYGLICLYEYYLKHGLQWRPKSKEFMRLLYAPVCLLGLLGYSVFLWAQFGEPLAFAKAQAAWYGDQPPGAFNLRHFLAFTNVYREGNWHAISIMHGPAIASVCFVVFPVLLIRSFREVPRVMLIYAGVLMLFLHFVTHSNVTGMGSMGRYLLIAAAPPVAFGLLLNDLHLKLREKFKVLDRGIMPQASILFVIVIVGWPLARVYIKLLKDFFKGAWVS